MDKAKAALKAYLKKEKIVPSKTKTGVGAMIGKVSQVADLQHLTSLVEAVGWELSYFKEKFDTSTGEKRPAAIYLGPPNKENELDIDDFVDSI